MQEQKRGFTSSLLIADELALGKEEEFFLPAIVPLLPDIGARSIDNPLYLLPADKVRDIATVVLGYGIGQPANWYLNFDRALKVMNTITQTAKTCGWSEIRFFGGQALFVAKIEIVK